MFQTITQPASLSPSAMDATLATLPATTLPRWWEPFSLIASSTCCVCGLAYAYSTYALKGRRIKKLPLSILACSALTLCLVAAYGYSLLVSSGKLVSDGGSGMVRIRHGWISATLLVSLMASSNASTFVVVVSQAQPSESGRTARQTTKRLKVSFVFFVCMEVLFWALALTIPKSISTFNAVVFFYVPLSSIRLIYALRHLNQSLLRVERTLKMRVQITPAKQKKRRKDSTDSMRSKDSFFMLDGTAESTTTDVNAKRGERFRGLLSAFNSTSSVRNLLALAEKKTSNSSLTRMRSNASLHSVQSNASLTTEDRLRRMKSKKEVSSPTSPTSQRRVLSARLLSEIRSPTSSKAQRAARERRVSEYLHRTRVFRASATVFVVLYVVLGTTMLSLWFARRVVPGQYALSFACFQGLPLLHTMVAITYVRRIFTQSLARTRSDSGGRDRGRRRRLCCASRGKKREIRPAPPSSPHRSTPNSPRSAGGRVSRASSKENRSRSSSKQRSRASSKEDDQLALGNSSSYVFDGRGNSKMFTASFAKRTDVETGEEIVSIIEDEEELF